MSVIDELQLQRCVDGELSSEEQRELFARLDRSADGWRRLALLSLEERMLSHALRPGAMTEFVRPVAVTDTASARPVASRSTRRWVVRGVAGAAAVAIAWIGLTLDWGGLSSGPAPFDAAAVMRRESTNSDEAVAEAAEGVQTPVSAEPVSSEVDSDRGAPVVDLQLVGVTDTDGAPLVIPVYEQADWSRQWEAWQQQLDVSAVDLQWTEQGLAVERERTWYAIPLANQQEILVPTETVVVGSTIH